MKSTPPLAPPARYFPIERGLYEVAPGLKALGTDFGNGEADKLVLQLDCEAEATLLSKERARSEDLSKYVGTERLGDEARAAVCRFLARRAQMDHPGVFGLQEASDGGIVFSSRLTGETIIIDPVGQLVSVTGRASEMPYSDAWDALMSQFQEDAAVVSREGEKNWISAIHVCSPSHWAPREKLGRDFASLHGPVPGFERMAKMQAQLVGAMIEKGPFVRFVWSFVTDTRLNHHPDAPPGEDPLQWKGRSFQLRRASPFHLRIERQTTFGLRDVEAALFFIRLSFLDSVRIKENEGWRTNLLGALRSMAPEARVYKGVADCFTDLVSWLEG